MSKLLQNVNMAGTALFFKILVVRALAKVLRERVVSSGTHKHVCSCDL